MVWDLPPGRLRGLRAQIPGREGDDLLSVQASKSSVWNGHAKAEWRCK